MGFYLVCLGFKNLYIAVLFVLLVVWCQFLFMVILFLTFYLLGIKFLELPWRIFFLMLGDFSCMKNSNLIFFKVWIFFDWYVLQWLLLVDFQFIHTEVLHSLLFLMSCTFINRDSLCILIQYILMWFLFYRFLDCHAHVTSILCLKAIQLLDYYQV